MKFVWNHRAKKLTLLDAFLCSLLVPTNDTNVLEFGVFQGDWILTICANKPNGRFVGIDPYPNSDHIRQKFMKRLQEYPEISFLLLESFSDLVARLNHNYEKFQLIHVDGEHTELAVYQDLLNANKVLDDSGVIAVDDVFFHRYPGVTFGLFRALNETDLCPFLITQKKMYLCRKPIHHYFMSKSRELLGQYQVPYFDDEGVSKEYSWYAQTNSVCGSSVVTVDVHMHSERILARNLRVPRPIFSRESVRADFSGLYRAARRSKRILRDVFLL